MTTAPSVSRCRGSAGSLAVLGTGTIALTLGLLGPAHAAEDDVEITADGSSSAAYVVEGDDVSLTWAVSDAASSHQAFGFPTSQALL